MSSLLDWGSEKNSRTHIKASSLREVPLVVYTLHRKSELGYQSQKQPLLALKAGARRRFTVQATEFGPANLIPIPVSLPNM